MIAAYVASFARRIWETFRDGIRLWWVAPLFPLIAALPEFAQHVAEIHLGMFDSQMAFKALQNDPLRWTFGYAKIAGLFVCMLATARFWAGREDGGRWWDLRAVAWRPFLLGFLLSAAVSGAASLLQRAMGDTAAFTLINGILQVVTLPFMILLIGGLLGDRAMTLRKAYTSGWLKLLLIAVMFVGFMLAPQPLHRLDHTLAMGAPLTVVWALMVWDSLLVGTMAALAGTAFHHGYQPLRRKGEMG